MFKSDQGWDDNCYMVMALWQQQFGDNDTHENDNVGNDELCDGEKKDDKEH